MRDTRLCGRVVGGGTAGGPAQHNPSAVQQSDRGLLVGLRWQAAGGRQRSRVRRVWRIVCSMCVIQWARSLAKRCQPTTGSPRSLKITGSAIWSNLAKLGWRVERDYHELRQELPWPLRGSRLARLSPSRHARHCSIWVPALRESNDPPQNHAVQHRSKRPCSPVVSRSAVSPHSP